MGSISIPGAVGGPVQRFSKDETTLLQKINEGLSEASWNRYHALCAKLEAETLTAEEHLQLLTLSNEIEMANAARLGLVWELLTIPITLLCRAWELRRQAVQQLRNCN